MATGKCKHGQFDLAKGCPQCMEDTLSGRAELAKPHIVKVQYYSETTGELSPREYIYYSADRLNMGDIVILPVRDTTGKAKVSAIDVPEAEIVAFKDKVKTVPSGAKVEPRADFPQLDAMSDIELIILHKVTADSKDPSDIEFTAAIQAKLKERHIAITKEEPEVDTNINLCDTCSKRNDYPICTAADVAFGDGTGNDNIILCKNYDRGEAAPCSIPMNTIIIPEPLPDKTIAETADIAREIIAMDGAKGTAADVPTTLLGPEAGKTMEEYGEATAALTIEINTTPAEMKPGADAEVVSYHEEAVKLLGYASSPSSNIVDADSLKASSDDLSIISRLKKAMEAKRKEKLAPLKAEVEAIQATYAFYMTPILDADKIIRAKIGAWDIEVKRIKAEVEAINLKRHEAAQQEMKLKGEISEPVNLVEEYTAPSKATSELGSTGVRDNWTYEITDFSELSDTYKVEDAALLTNTARKYKDQKQVPGVRFFNKPVVVNRPR